MNLNLKYNDELCGAPLCARTSDLLASADIAPWPNVDNLVDYEDLAKLAEQWLAGTQ